MRSGMRSSARSRTSRFRGRSVETSIAGLPTGWRRSAVRKTSRSSSRITTSRCWTIRSRTAISPPAPCALSARPEIVRSHSTHTRPLQGSIAARSRSRASEDRGRLLYGLGSTLAALADGEAVDRLVEASASLQAAGDVETAAEAEANLAQIAWNTGDAPGSKRISSGPWSSSASVHRPPRMRGRSARQHASKCSPAAGAKPSRRACERSGWPPSSVSTQSEPMCSRPSARRGGTWAIREETADLELAIELAEAASAPLALSRAINNLAFRYGTSTSSDLTRSWAGTTRRCSGTAT